MYDVGGDRRARDNNCPTKSYDLRERVPDGKGRSGHKPNTMNSKRLNKPDQHGGSGQRHAVWTSFGLTLLVTLTLAGCSANKPPAQNTSSPQTKSMADPLAFQYFSLGSIAFAEADYPTAAASFERALRFDPDSREIRMSLAETYFRMRTLDRAITLVQAIPDHDQSTLEFLGKCFRYAGRDRDAEDVYQALVRKDSANASAYWYLSRLALKDGRMEEAGAWMAKSAQLRGDVTGLNEAGDLMMRSGKPEQALDAFRESVKRDSSLANRAALVGMAQSLEALGRPDEAVAAYRRVLARNPDDYITRKRLINHFLFTEQRDSAITEIKTLLESNPGDPERLRLGMLWYATGDTARAESLFTAVDAEEPAYITALYLGRIAAERGDHEEAKVHLRRAIAENDSIPDAWVHLVNSLVDQDSIDAAITLAETAASRIDNPKPVWYFLGITFSRRESYDTAAHWLARAFEEDTLDTRVQFALAAARERSGQFDEAATMFKNLLTREPANAPALNYLGYMYADSGVHLQESLELIQRALEQDPQNGAYLDSYGWVLFRLGRYEEAEVEIRKALAILDSDPVIHEHLGDILAAQGREDEARRHWERALELDPKNELVRNKID